MEIAPHLVALFFLAVLILFAVYFLKKKSSERFKNIILLSVSILLLFLLLEVVFCFIPKSNNAAFTLAHQRWENYYWVLTENGFRDAALNTKNRNKKKLVFIGDSFTAGQGIKDPQDRFSNIIGTAVKDSFEFWNFGLKGLNTEGKEKTMKYMDIWLKPDVLVYQYFLDDIIDTRMRMDSTRPSIDPFKGYSVPAKYLINNSYLVNYVYWLFPHYEFSDYAKYLTGSYDNPAVAAEHKKVISRIIYFCKTRNIRLVFLFVPVPDDKGGATKYTAEIEKMVSDSLVPSVNLSSVFKAYPLEEIVVNNQDHHYNERANKIIANEIFRVIFNRDISLADQKDKAN